MNLLLHICCAPCSAYVIKKLQENYTVTMFYFNPNIYPEAEYIRRRDEAKDYSEKLGIDFIDKDVDHVFWLDLIKGFENEPERGNRCGICYKMRLDETAKYAKENNFDIFTTTLSISPHKSSVMINCAGVEVSNIYDIKYLEADFKKDDGFKKSCKISEEEGFYRQDYCGCEFSIVKKFESEKL